MHFIFKENAEPKSTYVVSFTEYIPNLFLIYTIKQYSYIVPIFDLPSAYLSTRIEPNQYQTTKLILDDPVWNYWVQGRENQIKTQKNKQTNKEHKYEVNPNSGCKSPS